MTGATNTNIDASPRLSASLPSIDRQEDRMGVTLPKQGTEWGKLKTEMETRGSHHLQ